MGRVWSAAVAAGFSLSVLVGCGSAADSDKPEDVAKVFLEASDCEAALTVTSPTPADPGLASCGDFELYSNKTDCEFQSLNDDATRTEVIADFECADGGIAVTLKREAVDDKWLVHDANS